MANFNATYKNKSKLALIEYKIKFPEAVQERICEIVNFVYYDLFCKVEVKKRSKKKSTLVCEVENLLPLSLYLKSSLSKNTFLDIVTKVIDVIKFCEDKLLNPNNLELRNEAIFIDPHTKKLKFVYWPIVNNQNYVAPKDFFKTLINKANLSNNQIDDWNQKYNLFFKNLKPFSLKNFEELILKLQGKGLTTQDIAPASRLLTHEDDLLTSSKKLEYSSDQIYNPIEASKNRAKRNNLENVFKDNIYNTKSCAYLLMKSKDIKIPIKKNLFKLGKSNHGIDFNISKNTISRHHADIIFENNTYYIIDQNSTNHTFVNKKLIQPYQPTKLNSGDIIKVANEELIFYIL